MSLKKLQEKAGVEADGVFGPATFKAASAYLGITEHARAVHFFAQVAHETGNFRYFVENLNYSANALQRVFKKYFPTAAEAKEYARKPKKIANKVYANRMGNGDEASGDGWKYRGRGALQLTGRNNYQAFENYLQGPCVLDFPDKVKDEYAFESAMFFFDTNKLWRICDQGLDEGTIRLLTRRINGGFNGLAHRIELTNKFKNYSL